MRDNGVVLNYGICATETHVMTASFSEDEPEVTWTY